MDKEFFECDEYKKSEEIQLFPAERYFIKETEKSASEIFNAPEITIPENSPELDNPSGISLSDAEEFVQSASASASASVSLSASASVGIGATGVMAGIAAVCIAATVGIVPVSGLTQNNGYEPPIYQIEEPIEVGTLNFLNYRIDYYNNEDSYDVNSDITFFFEGTLADGFTCELSDTITGKSVAVIDEAVIFKNIEKGDREFLLTIYHNEEVVETRPINVTDNYIYNPDHNFDYTYKVTYNSDGTCNLYTYFIPEYDGNFVTFIDIYDIHDNLMNSYETVTDGALSYILNINEEEYKAKFVSYYVKDNNYYSYCLSEEIYIDNNTFIWQANVNDKLLNITFGNEIVGDVQIKVTHDDLTCEEFVFPAKELIDNSCLLTLNKISHNPIVEIIVDSVLYNYDPFEHITVFNGKEYKRISESVNVKAVVSSTVNLTKCEIFNPSYNFESGDAIHAPVFLYFDGFLNEGDTYSVKVFSMDGNIVDSVTDISLSDKPVIFTNLTVDMEYTFTFYLNSSGEEIPLGEITKTLTVPDYSFLPPLFCWFPNPGDVMITYNEDGTSNIYLYMNVQKTEYDMYYKVYLVDVAYSDFSVFFEYAGSDNVAILRNIPTGRYSIKYGVLINNNDTCYSTCDMQWPSGTVVAGLNESGYYPEPCGDVSYDYSNNELSLSVSGKVVEDLRVTITPDIGQAIEITIPVEDISANYSFSTYTLNLSAYGLTSFTTVIESYAVFQYGNGEKIKNEVSVTGDEFCPFKIESSF